MDTRELTTALLSALRQHNWRLAVAESCTGGLISAALTDIAGASDVFDRGFVTYANEAKMDLLGVPADLIISHGAVSAEVAVAMATGARERSGVNIAGAVTGIAGPGGGSAEKPVGLVFIAVSTENSPPAVQQHTFADLSRDAIREKAVQATLSALLEASTDP
ncbi:MAG: CinA family protein [Alphaproteobacteria bacterium]|nr:CinA family protein [Alphaproteobacteria bacterium]